MEWVRRLSIAYEWQDAIIRAAITLKLSNFEETGGIVAALTTSIPEAPGSGRTWDYRYCWLRDAYFVVKALNRLGATKTMEGFISFILGIASEGSIRPVYSVVPTDSMDEIIAPSLKGYRNDGPVRVGNAAAQQTQHDTFGSIILAAMPMFFDRRLPRQGNEGLFLLLESLGLQAAKLRSRPTRASGNIAAAATFIPIPRQCVGPAAVAWRQSPCISACATALHTGRRRQMKFRILCSSRPGARSAAPSPPGLVWTISISSVLLLPEIGLIEPDDPRYTQDCCRHWTRALTRQPRDALCKCRTTLGCPKRRS